MALGHKNILCVIKPTKPQTTEIPGDTDNSAHAQLSSGIKYCLSVVWTVQRCGVPVYRRRSIGPLPIPYTVTTLNTVNFSNNLLQYFKLWKSDLELTITSFVN